MADMEEADMALLSSICLEIAGNGGDKGIGYFEDMGLVESSSCLIVLSAIDE